MSADLLEFIVVVVGGLLIVGVVIELWNLLEHRHEDAEEEHARQVLKRRYGRPPERR